LFRRLRLPHEHLLALRAALLEGEEAQGAFAEWRRSVDFDTTDAPSYRLLPLIYRNLGSGPGDDPVLGRMAGIYRRTWVLNTIQLREGERAIATLSERGIPTVLLKGAAMIARWTDDPGVRMMSDVDLLVPRDRALEAVERLVADGWRPAIARSGPRTEADLDDEHAILLRTKGNSELDLHWRALIHGGGQASDDALWDRVQEVGVNGVRTHVLAPEDHVHHACSHATTWTAAGRVDWIADAALILRAVGSEFKWSRVVELARLDRSELPVRTLTGALGEVLGTPEPKRELRELRVRRPAIAERIEISLRRRMPHELGRAGEFFLALQDHRRQTRGLLQRPLIAAIPSFARARWRVEGVRGVIAHLAYRALGRPRWFRRVLVRRVRPRDLGARDLAALDAGSLDLRTEEDVQKSLLGGWSFAEAGGRWTDGDEAALALRTAQPADDLAVEVIATPLLHPEHRELDVEVWANDQYVVTWAYRLGEAASSSRSFVLPRDSLADIDALEIAFVFRDPCRPMALGISHDPRRLGLFVRELRFSHA
jgi:hypothetical protein